MTWTTTPDERDAGAATLEAAILAVPLLLLLMLAIAFGRASQANTAVEGAAQDAARAASISRDPGTAQSSGQAAAATTMRQTGMACTPQVTIDTSGFGTTPGTPAVVRATVSCTVSFADLPRIGIGSRTITATAVSPLDTYRER